MMRVTRQMPAKRASSVTPPRWRRLKSRRASTTTSTPTAVLEAVGDGLRDRIYADLDALQAMRLYTFGEGCSRETCHPQPRGVEPRLARLLGKRDPHLGRRLGGQAVETQRREKAEGACRDPLGDLRERMLGRVRVLACDVDSPRLPRDQSLPDQAVWPHTGDAARFEIDRAHEAHLPDDTENRIFGGSGHGRRDRTKRRELCASSDVSNTAVAGQSVGNCAYPIAARVSITRAARPALALIDRERHYQACSGAERSLM